MDFPRGLEKGLGRTCVYYVRFVMKEVQSPQNLSQTLTDEIRLEFAIRNQISEFFQIHPQSLENEARMFPIWSHDFERVQKRSNVESPAMLRLQTIDMLIDR